MSIDTDRFSISLRRRAIDPDVRALLVSDLRGSEQEGDLTDPPNCGGYGRVRHFRRATSEGWPDNSLPIDPACAALGLPPTDQLRAQVFQNAACNWRCWYCYVPFSLLAADERRAAWFTADELVGRYLDQHDPPPVLDLSGGQPDLVPEWVPWTMRALTDRGVADRVYLWSDDNLSNDYLWRYLEDADLRLLAEHPAYGRVCCFKGYDAASFAFNTGAAPALFDRQFELFARLLDLGVDLYAYVTLTSPTADGVEDGVRQFVDRLQRIAEPLPLRTVPLEVQVFTPVTGRLNAVRDAALTTQRLAAEAWRAELDARFSTSDRARRVIEVPLHA